MHSLIVSVVALAIAAVEVLGTGFPSGLTLGALILGVGLVGIPHGAADHWSGRTLLAPYVGSLWLPVFLSSYLLISAVVLIGWHVAPTITILAFFLLAAWHFGVEDRSGTTDPLLPNLRAIACGGMVIWIPSLANAESVAALLRLTSASVTLESSRFVISAVTAVSPLLALLVLLDCYLEYRNDRSAKSERKWLHSNFTRYSALSVLFFVADPLLSFGIYFCGWHSIRSLHELQARSGYSWRHLSKQLAPLTMVTLILFVIGFALWSRGLTVSQASIRWLFLGLAAIAVPHLLLETLSAIPRKPVLRAASPIRGAQA